MRNTRRSLAIFDRKEIAHLGAKEIVRLLRGEEKSPPQPQKIVILVQSVRLRLYTPRLITLPDAAS